MKAHYVNDPDKGRGYGRILITDTPELTYATGLTFVIKRASDRQTLGLSGWQPAQKFLSPDTVGLGADGLALGVGPAVVDKLDTQENYRISLHSADGTVLTSSLIVPEVMYSPLEAGQRVTEAPSPAAQAAEPVSLPEALAEAEEELDDPTPPKRRLVSCPQSTDFLAANPARRPHGSLRQLLGVASLMLLIAIGGVSAWKFWVQNGNASSTEQAVEEEALQTETPPDVQPENAAQPTDDAEPDVTEQREQRAAEHPSGGDVDETATPSSPNAAAENPLKRARELLADDPAPEESLNAAKLLRADPKSADAAFLLAEDAAQKGLADAMLLTGQFYDPTDIEPSGTIIKDPLEALSWYAKAKEAGHADAPTRLDVLRTWAEEQAAQGSEDARQLLTRFERM